MADFVIKMPVIAVLNSPLLEWGGNNASVCFRAVFELLFVTDLFRSGDVICEIGF